MKVLRILSVTALLLASGLPAQADNKAVAIDEMAGYLELIDYGGGGVIFTEQIPRDEYKNILVIDARDAVQFSKGHIPGAVDNEWRKVLEQREKIPKDKLC
jgi:hypothetical protein